MIKELVARWENAKPAIQAKFELGAQENYIDLVKTVVENVTSLDEYVDFNLDPDRIHEIDDGHYHGTLIYVIAEKGYQPSNYWYVKVYYGSCSGCDTLQAINAQFDSVPDEEAVKSYMTLALHIVQGIKQMGEDNVND